MLKSTDLNSMLNSNMFVSQNIVSPSDRQLINKATELP